MKQQTIPTQVSQEAEELVSMYGQRVEYLGQMPDGRAAYYYHYPDDVCAGFPTVWLYGSGQVMELNDHEALEVISAFC
ncbi:MAG: hypothetical protein NC301_07600 [Bacteroides sp.]|nr:hypothetical protein [Bacteroides sp.]MCM1380053.1 hypothetical protein [Bacteroides sp.]MCM1446352.1 hypothetical protein [Prevotella sp.]